MHARITTDRLRWRWLSETLAALVLCLAPLASPAVGANLDQLPQRWRGDDGHLIELSSLAGRRLVLTMGYARCHVICPLTIGQLQEMQRRLDDRGEQAEFVVIGYDPENERPTDWHAFRTSRHLDRGNWHFLMGSRSDTERLARQLGFDFWKYDEHVMHGMRALVFDARGTVQVELGAETKDWAAAI